MTALLRLRALCGAARTALMALLTTLLVACGPGVGGSGTGAEPMSPPGTALLPTPSMHADAIDGRQVQATLDAGRLRVELACPRLRFDGQWDGVSDGSLGGTLRFDGTLDGNAARTARADVVLDGSTLVLTLRDAAGRDLLSPQRLPAIATLPPLAGC